MTHPAVGFDFGTSTTVIASGEHLVEIGETYPWMPSLVGYDGDGGLVVGEAVQREAVAGQTIRSVKRAITQRRTAIRVDAPGGLREVGADEMIVAVLRRAARRCVGAGLDLFEASSVQLGCPAMWDGGQRRRLLELAHRAGLPVTMASVVEEPVAAGIAWLARRPPLRNGSTSKLVVFDMGGGTLDVAVLRATGTGIRVLSTVGLAEAGDALDDAIADDLDHALGAAGLGPDVVPRDRIARELLLDAARRLKVSLTTQERDVVVLPPDVFGRNETWYRREQLEAAFGPQLERAADCVAVALRAARLAESVPFGSGPVGDAAERSVGGADRAPGGADRAQAGADRAVGGVDRAHGGADSGREVADRDREVADLVRDVDAVVLAGGMCHVPGVARRLRAMFSARTVIELATSHPEAAVALGLAAAAGYGRSNNCRPGFDIHLEWDEGRQSRLVYEAYQPLVENWQVDRGTNLRFVRTGRDLSLPDEGTAQLRVSSPAGRAVRAELEGSRLDGFAVVLQGGRFEFSIRLDGSLELVDGAGTHQGRIHLE
jgi:molecular chaperone DnaK (HSP70)